jgi:hypothetical protein
MNNNSLGATAQARQPATHERSQSPLSSPIGECQAQKKTPVALWHRGCRTKNSSATLAGRIATPASLQLALTVPFQARGERVPTSATHPDYRSAR